MAGSTEDGSMICVGKVAQFNRGRVSDSAQAALCGSQKEVPGYSYPTEKHL